MSNVEFYDVVIIGAGPAGSVSAAYLHKQGKKVLVLEKEEFPRFVIGESLLPHCMDHLEETELLDVIKQADFQVKNGATFFLGDKQCSFDFTDHYTDGWKWTWQVKRADFDKLLIDEVEKKGVIVRFRCSVTNVNCSAKNQEVTYVDENGTARLVQANYIIDASGYGRVLPKQFKLDQPSDLEGRGAIFTHVIDKNRQEGDGNNITVHSFRNNTSWIWVIPFADGSTSIGVVSENEHIKELANNNASGFNDFVSNFKGLNGRFLNMEQLFEPKHLLGYSIGVKHMYGDGYVLCGNSTEFLDPIFSSGVTLATASGLLAAKLVNRELNNEKVDWQVEYEDYLKEGIEVFRSYVKAWYSGEFHEIIFAKTIHQEIKRQISSVLAGYVWDKSNPFIKKHKTILKSLAKVTKIKSRQLILKNLLGKILSPNNKSFTVFI